MLLPKNIKTSSSHPSAVSSRKHCSEGHCGMPSSPIHHQVSFLVSRPTILVSLLSSFCDNSHTLSLPPWQVTREPKPKYIQIQYIQNVTRIVQSWLTQSSIQQPRSITHWLDKVNSSWTRRYSCPRNTCSSKPSWIWQHSWDLNHWLLLSERIQMLKVSRFNNFYCVIFSIIVICIANFWLFALCCFLQINRFYIWFKTFLLGIARISLTPPWHFRSAILNQRHIEGTISLSSTSWLVFGWGLSSKPEWLSPNSPHQGFVVTLVTPSPT